MILAAELTQVEYSREYIQKASERNSCSGGNIHSCTKCGE